MCNHENNVPSRVSPQWLCDNSCTSAHDVRLHIAGTIESKSAQQAIIYITLLALLADPSLVNWYQQCLTVHQVPKCMSCHKAIVVITGRAHCFHDCISTCIHVHIFIIIILKFITMFLPVNMCKFCKQYFNFYCKWYIWKQHSRVFLKIVIHFRYNWGIPVGVHFQ